MALFDQALKKRLAELEKANRELDDVFNAMGDLVFVIDKDNVVTRANNACASFLLQSYGVGK